MQPPFDLDPLDAALTSLRPRGAFLYRSELGAPWGLTAPAGPATFHLVEAGRCQISVGEHDAWLEPGDLALVPHGSEAVFRDVSSSSAPSLESLLARHPPGASGVLRNGAPGPKTVLVCGGVAFDDAVAHPLLDALPSLLVLPGAAHDGTPWLAQTLRFLACESASGRLGAATVMGHLGSVVFVQAIRAALGGQTLGGVPPGWLGALSDPHVGPALRAIQQTPDRPWTIEALGTEAGLGRSAFAARFREAVGEPPMRHVTRWRMYRAGQLLRDGGTLAETAGAVGYESEAAFSRAFRRWTGRTPGAVRRAASRHAPLSAEPMLSPA